LLRADGVRAASGVKVLLDTERVGLITRGASATFDGVCVAPLGEMR
jgi:hypothetical protein